MASTSAAEPVVSSSTTVEEPRAEAGPLPIKRGELGYQEEIHGQQQSQPAPEVAPLPARHPADRDATPTPAATADNSNATANDASSTSSMCKRKRLLAFFKAKKAPTYGGITLATIMAFLLQLSLIAGTITAWALCIKYIMHPKDDDNSKSGMSSTSSLIFIHVVFGIALVGQLLFLERRIYRMRAERYAFLHPGQMLPTSRSRPVDPSIAFSPWNRPPLPTYAAALAQSGVGTGDVEDNIIAAPPPPAYGNTRGSRLLLTGFLNDQQRAQRPVSAHTQMSQREDTSRPASYMSHDSEWEIIQDARRSMQLEATLARLERPSSRT